jgi:hypothetical protein
MGAYGGRQRRILIWIARSGIAQYCAKSGEAMGYRHPMMERTTGLLYTVMES